MEMKFTESVYKAVEAMCRLITGTLSYDNVPLPKPLWGVYASFDKLKCSPIRKLKAHDSDSWIAGRTVEFFHRQHLLARVELITLQCKGENNGEIEKSNHWTVKKIGYSMSYIKSLSPSDWYEVERQLTWAN